MHTLKISDAVMRASCRSTAC